MDSKQKILIKFGERVREIRKEKGLSQEELARLQTSCSVLLGSANTYSSDTFNFGGNSFINSANFQKITCPSYIPQAI